jgi:hypothetical protein
MMGITRRLALAAAVLGLMAGAAGRTDAAQSLTFEDIPLGPDGTANVWGNYQDPATDSDFVVTGDFQARGEDAGWILSPETSAGSQDRSTSLFQYANGTVTLTNSTTWPYFDPNAPDSLYSQPFSLLSIDLARENFYTTPVNFVPYPVVTFTGRLVGGGTVSQTFTVDQAEFAFATFEFGSDFTNLSSVSWRQPGTGQGQHQFDNIRVMAAVPEPATLATAGLGLLMALGYAWRCRRAAA